MSVFFRNKHDCHEKPQSILSRAIERHAYIFNEPNWSRIRGREIIITLLKLISVTWNLALNAHSHEFFSVIEKPTILLRVLYRFHPWINYNTAGNLTHSAVRQWKTFTDSNVEFSPMTRSNKSSCKCKSDKLYSLVKQIMFMNSLIWKY